MCFKKRKEGIKINNKNIFYVYEWIRLDTNEPFYIGKGCGDRWRNLKRGNNNYFNNIVKNIPVAVNILEDNLDEKTAYEYEKFYIYIYQYDWGFNLVNLTIGGDAPPILKGKNNPMYGRTWYDKDTPIEKINDWKLKVAKHGKENGMYKHIYSEETIRKMRKAKEGRFLGKENPNYGNKTLRNKLKDNPELKMIYYPRVGGQNGRSKGLFMINTNSGYIEYFDYLFGCAKILKDKFNLSIKETTIINKIKKSIKEDSEYLGYRFCFEN